MTDEYGEMIRKAQDALDRSKGFVPGHPYKLPGKTLAESLGIDTSGAPGGQRVANANTDSGCHRVTHFEDRDANHHPEFDSTRE